jgi:hypothetical protein
MVMFFLLSLYFPRVRQPNITGLTIIFLESDAKKLIGIPGKAKKEMQGLGEKAGVLERLIPSKLIGGGNDFH